MYEGALPSVTPQSECRCASQTAKISDQDMTYCSANVGSHTPTTSVYRLNKDAHLPEFVADGKTDTKWISRLGLDDAYIAIDLQDDFEVRGEWNTTPVELKLACIYLRVGCSTVAV